MSFIQNLFTSRDNNANAETYVGQEGRIWWNPDTNAFYYSDGNTAGGIPIGGGGGGNGTPGGPVNSIQYNAGSGTFGGTANLVINPASGNITATGNIRAAYLYGDGGNITNLPLANNTSNISGNNITITANGTFGNISVTNTANLGNFTIYDQTLSGTIADRDVNIVVVGATANVNIDGPLNVHGAGNLEAPPQFEVKSDGQSIFRVPTLDANLGAVQIIGTTSGAVVGPANPGGMLQITGQNNQVSRVYNDAVNNYPLYVGRRYNGTALAPTGVLANQVISRLGANPYLTDTAGFTALGVAQINFVATENQTTTAQGSKITMNTTPTGSNVQSQVAEFNYGGIILTGNLLPTTDDVYSLGNASLRWMAAHFGNAGIYIQDNTLGDDGQLLLDNGVLNFDNIDSLRVGNLQFTKTGIITTIDPALDVLIGNPGDTGNTVIRNAGIKFTDGTIQTTAAIPLTQKGNAFGVVPLNAATKIDPIYLPSGAITFKGIWDAANNSPTLADGVGSNGDEYIVGTAGTQNLGSGNITFAVGDFVLYTSANVWVDIPVGGSGVDSFNGRTGIVTLQSGDVTNALTTGSIVNSKLANTGVTINTGAGLSGGGAVALGGSLTLTVTGVVNVLGGTGVNVVTAGGNATVSIGQPVGTANSVQFFAVTSNTTVQATGNVTGGNLITGGRVIATGNIETSGFFKTPTTTINSGIVTTGNITGGNLVGNNLTPTRVTFVGPAKGITDDGDFTYDPVTNTLSVGNVSATGNVTAAYYYGNGSTLTGTTGGSTYYAQFWSTVSQVNAGATAANPMTFDTSDTFNNGISVASNSHVVIANPGIYNIQFSAQFAKTDSGQDTVSIWLAKDGVNVPDTCTDIDLNNNNARSVAAWNFLVEVTVPNTYYELYWSSADTNMSILAQGARINPTRPAIPSVIVTVTQA
jgi:hypothetical protein